MGCDCFHLPGQWRLALIMVNHNHCLGLTGVMNHFGRGIGSNHGVFSISRQTAGRVGNSFASHCSDSFPKFLAVSLTWPHPGFDLSVLPLVKIPLPDNSSWLTTNNQQKWFIIMNRCSIYVSSLMLHLFIVNMFEVILQVSWRSCASLVL